MNVESAIAAAKAGDRALFESLWARMTDAERWELRGAAIVAEIKRRAR